MEQKRRKLRIPDLQQRKRNGEPLVQLLVTNHRDAAVADSFGADIITASDAAGLMLFGMDSSTDMTLDDMILVGRGIARNVRTAICLVAMPYWTYQVSPQQAVENAGRLIQATGADGVSCEVNRHHRDAVAAIVQAGIPVQAHIGLSSQRSAQLGGVRGLGKTMDEAWEFVDDASAMAEAGCFSIIAELLAAEVTGHIASTVPIPVISIGSGGSCDGAGGLFEDLYGLAGTHVPRHAKVYHTLGPMLEEGMQNFVADIRARTYPQREHSVVMEAAEARKFKTSITRRNRSTAAS
ncbi:3-methyl-2-oxobutanoate hydroxymethyltransferase [Arthrobacter mangrovi]|uniref:3-methyl-2-oxobutanoate hydroxymethyltransferase n=1 Tax=Arthrobacter mangrovi TaxID=2966350 RepID=A0ABQ5MZ72_9MICC|nr:3-methyl-2-oxobutanoate hydroxymethyltransferase [Arthrobacter mangrovi]GLB69175.1 3-methyl-2-oxobutanoate hydroxymethyltransferase [Arthrobacter mangrovi]